MEKVQISDPPKVWICGLPHESPMCSCTLPDICDWEIQGCKGDGS